MKFWKEPIILFRDVEHNKCFNVRSAANILSFSSRQMRAIEQRVPPKILAISDRAPSSNHALVEGSIRRDNMPNMAYVCSDVILGLFRVILLCGLCGMDWRVGISGGSKFGFIFLFLEGRNEPQNFISVYKLYTSTDASEQAIYFDILHF